MASTIFTFPLEPIGGFLRDLSLSGAAGNMVASILYGGICLIPVLIWFVLKKKQKMVKTDYLLFPLSALLFYVLYYSINPGLFHTNIVGTGGIYLSGLFYSALVTYGVIRIQSMAVKGSRNTIEFLLRFFLYLLAVIFAGMVLLEFAVSLPEAMNAAKDSYEQAAAFSGLVGMDLSIRQEMIYVTTVFDSVVKAIPYVLDVVIIFKAIGLLKELQKDWYSKESVAAAGDLSEVTGRTLVIITVMGFAYNLIQFFGRNSVAYSEMKISVPILSMVFLLAVLLLARYIKASQELKDENDMFI